MLWEEGRRKREKSVRWQGRRVVLSEWFALMSLLLQDH